MMVITGDFVATSGLYKLVGVLGDEEMYVFVYGDSVPFHRGERAKFKLIQAAKHPVKG